MKLKDLRFKDYANLPTGEQINLFEIVSHEQTRANINGKRFDAKSINDEWFDLERRIFLQQPFTQTELPFIALSILYMGDCFGEWDEDRLPAFFKLIGKSKVIDNMPIVATFWKELKELDARDMMLNYVPTSEEVQAGIDKLTKLGIFATLDNLSQRERKDRKEILKMPYSEVFAVLLKDKETNDFNSRLQKILMKK